MKNVSKLVIMLERTAYLISDLSSTIETSWFYLIHRRKASFRNVLWVSLDETMINEKKEMLKDNCIVISSISAVRHLHIDQWCIFHFESHFFMGELTHRWEIYLRFFIGGHLTLRHYWEYSFNVIKSKEKKGLTTDFIPQPSERFLDRWVVCCFVLRKCEMHDCLITSWDSWVFTPKRQWF